MSGSGPRSAATITSTFLELFMTTTTTPPPPSLSTVGTLTRGPIDAQTGSLTRTDARQQTVGRKADKQVEAQQLSSKSSEGVEV